MTKSRKQMSAHKGQKKKQKKHVLKKSTTSVGRILRNVGASVGSTYGPMGARIGSAAASYISHIMGQGDYKVSKNTLMSNGGPPSFSTNGDDVIIKHREYVGDILSSTAFTNVSRLINPGNANLFPWLSQLATSFEEYEFHGLVIEYKSTSGSAIASTNNALGSVCIATDYNVENSNFTTKRAMDTTEFSTSAGTDTSFLHPIECDKSRNVLPRQYVTSATTIGTIPGGDPRFYFLGNMQLATIGQQAAGITIGELWVSYQVRLSRPTFSSLSLTAPIPESNFHTCYSTSATTGLTIGVYPILGYSLSQGVGFQPGVSFTGEPAGLSVSPIKKAMPEGLYLVSVIQNIQTFSASSFTPTATLPQSILYSSNPTSTLQYNADDNTTGLASVVCNYSSNVVAIGSSSSTFAQTTFEVYFKPRLINQYNSTVILYVPTVYGNTTGTVSSCIDIRCVYLGPSNVTTSPLSISDSKDEVTSPLKEDYIRVSDKAEELSSTSKPVLQRFVTQQHLVKN